MKAEKTKSSQAISLTNYLSGVVQYDTLHSKADRPLSCERERCAGSHISQWKVHNDHAKYCSLDIFQKAEEFLREFYNFHDREPEFWTRWEKVSSEITTTGTYNLKKDELEFGARLAWRNATRCSARIQWNNLTLLDHRDDVTSASEMFDAICDHIKYTTNGGALRPAMTVFRQRLYGEEDLRVWNSMMVGYAGYRFEEEFPDDGVAGSHNLERKIGDQGNLEFTQFCQRLGWRGSGTAFDFLPIVVSADGTPEFFEMPEDLMIRIPITHPELKAIDEIKLEWYALPMVAGMMLEVGGLQFPAAPFAGWYTSIEIATRDLLEPTRYGLLQDIGLALGYDTSNNATLWKDRVALEMNVAVLHSFKLANVTIVDQHTVSESFQSHLEEEYRLRGGCPSDWVWLTPSQSGSLTPLYHQEMLHYHLSPSLEKQELLWKNYRFHEDGERRIFKMRSVVVAIRFCVALFRAKMALRPPVKIFFATETGVSKRYAEKLKKVFGRAFSVSIAPMNKIDIRQPISLTGFYFFVTSTFGNGDPPKMAECFAKWLSDQLTLKDIQISKRISFQAPASDNESTDTELESEPDDEIVSATMTRQTKTILKKMSTVEGFDFRALSFGVFALGSSAYPHFCGFGKWLDTALSRLEANRVVNVGLGDELGNRDGEFHHWSQIAFQKCCAELGVDLMTEPRQHRRLESAARWKVTDGLDLGQRDLTEISKDLSAHHEKFVSTAILRDRRVLSRNPVTEFLVRLEIPTETEEEPYKPGDHLVMEQR